MVLIKRRIIGEKVEFDKSVKKTGLRKNKIDVKKSFKATTDSKGGRINGQC